MLDTASGEVTSTLTFAKASLGTARVVAFLPDVRGMLVVGQRGAVLCALDAREVREVPLGRDGLEAVHVDPSGRSVIWATTRPGRYESPAHEIKLFRQDLATGALRAIARSAGVSRRTSAPGGCIAVSADGTRVARAVGEQVVVTRLRRGARRRGEEGV